MNKNDQRNAGTPTGQNQPPEQNVQPRREQKPTQNAQPQQQKPTQNAQPQREQKDVPGRDKQPGQQQGKTQAPGQQGTGQQDNRPPQPR